MKRLLPQLATLGVRRIFLVGAEKVEKAFWGAQLLKPEIYRPLLIEGLIQGAVSTVLPTIHQVKNMRRWIGSADFVQDFQSQPTRIVAHPYLPILRGLSPPNHRANHRVLSPPNHQGLSPCLRLVLKGDGLTRRSLCLKIMGLCAMGLGSVS